MSENLFKWKHFESVIIVLYGRWYLKYPLSYRMMVESMSERGMQVTHTTNMRKVHQYSQIIYGKYIQVEIVLHKEKVEKRIA